MRGLWHDIAGLECLVTTAASSCLGKATCHGYSGQHPSVYVSKCIIQAALQGRRPEDCSCTPCSCDHLHGRKASMLYPQLPADIVEAQAPYLISFGELTTSRSVSMLQAPDRGSSGAQEWRCPCAAQCRLGLQVRPAGVLRKNFTLHRVETSGHNFTTRFRLNL